MKQIKLTRGLFALIDDEDFKFLNQFKWFAQKGRYTFYANRTRLIDGKWRVILMHRVVLGIPNGGNMVDHKDGNGLNNQKYNLREATTQQNSFNKRAEKGGTSKYKGVYWLSSRKNWVADIRNNGKSTRIGSFKSEEEAALAYNIAALKRDGEFAFLNIINKT